ncbi:MAG TPA: hypothetical protein VJ873_03835, partial [bacterium]|nr:hypothetical protein [bacterium]
MVVPHDGGKPLQVKTSLITVHALVLGMAGLLIWAALVVSRDVNYQLAQLTEQRFKSNMQEIMGELETNRALLSRMAAVDTQFRKLLKLGNRKEVLS